MLDYLDTSLIPPWVRINQIESNSTRYIWMAPFPRRMLAPSREEQGPREVSGTGPFSRVGAGYVQLGHTGHVVY